MKIPNQTIISPLRNFLHDLYVFLCGDFQSHQVGFNDCYRKLFCYRYNQWSAKIESCVAFMASFLALKFTANIDQKLFKFIGRNNGQLGHLKLSRNLKDSFCLSNNRWRKPFFLNFGPSVFFKNLIEGSHFNNFFQKNIKSFVESVTSFLVGISLSGQIQRRAMADKKITLFENNRFHFNAVFIDSIWSHISPLNYTTGLTLTKVNDKDTLQPNSNFVSNFLKLT